MRQAERPLFARVQGRVITTHLPGGGPVSGPGGGEYPPGGGRGGFCGGGIREYRRAAARVAVHMQEAAHTRGAVEGNIPPAHICGHMDQDDSPAGTRVHLGGSSHKRHDESQGRSLPPQEHPISRMVVGAMQQGHNIAVCP